MPFNLSLAVRRSSRASPFLFLAPDIAARLLGKTTYSRCALFSSTLGFVYGLGCRVYIELRVCLSLSATVHVPSEESSIHGSEREGVLASMGDTAESLFLILVVRLRREIELAKARSVELAASSLKSPSTLCRGSQSSWSSAASGGASESAAAWKPHCKEPLPAARPHCQEPLLPADWADWSRPQLPGCPGRCAVSAGSPRLSDDRCADET